MSKAQKISANIGEYIIQEYDSRNGGCDVIETTTDIEKMINDISLMTRYEKSEANIVIIEGTVGTGKTALCSAICDYVSENNKDGVEGNFVLPLNSMEFNQDSKSSDLYGHLKHTMGRDCDVEKIVKSVDKCLWVVDDFDVSQ